MIDLDQPADLLWIPANELPEAGADWTGNQRHFTSLREAVRFAVEDLGIADRANVWITTEEGNLTVEQIEQLYEGLLGE